MAAIEPDITRRALLRLLSVSAAATTLLPAAAPPRDVRATIAYLASALANNNPADALTVFASTCPGYSQLTDYFKVLTNAYEIASEVEITDESTAGDNSDVEATWSITLTGLTTQTTERRARNVKLHLARTPNKPRAPWKITRFEPLDLFKVG